VNNNIPIKQIIRQTLQLEAEVLTAISQMNTTSIEEVVNIIFNSTDKVILTGVGKSAIVAKKMAATLNSTGTPSIYLHAGDAVHGDMGIIQKHDLVLIFSKSGNSDELKQLVPQIANRGARVIAFTSNQDGLLTQMAEVTVHIPISKEADPHGLVPTSSVIGYMSVCDAIAMALQQANGFTERSFAEVHPGGRLGKRLNLKIRDLNPNLSKPVVHQDSTVKATILEMSSKRKGAVAVCEDDSLLGVITDGDLRRMLEKHEDIRLLTAQNIMTTDPKTVTVDTLAYEALKLMENHNISQILVMEDEVYLGIVHIHDLIAEGL